MQQIMLKSSSQVHEQSKTATNNNENLAIKLDSAYKAYGKFKVLQNLNLNVYNGSIYGLLGPSGCGKTTILKVIVGRTQLDSGRVEVFKREPGSKGHQIPGALVGYMPQEIALYDEFTISELLIYFGLFYDMNMQSIKKRREFLIEFLQLPQKEKLVKQLSGGQKRRVSMAVALLHEPKLLILDEPTVGVDPLLREKIWDHLSDISKNSNITIIITTHYIEEARKADQVGLMRNGRILAEDSPNALIEFYKETTLENVFLKLCTRDSNQEIFTSDIEQDKKSITSKASKYLSSTFRLPKWHNYLSLLLKDSILMRRNIGFLLFQFLIPVIQMALFCLCIGKQPNDLKFGIVNNETIQKSGYNASTLYINELSDKIFQKIYVRDWSEAYKKAKNGELWGFLEISANFTADTINKFNVLNILENKSFPASNVNIYMDTTNQQIAYTIKADVLQAYQTFLGKFLADYITPKISNGIFESPVIFQEPIYGQADPQFINYMAPGIMVTIIFTLAIGLTALMFVLEKKGGLMDRNYTAGVSIIEIMSAHVTVKFFIMAVQIVLVIVISTFVFEVTIEGPAFISALLLLLQGFCGMSYGLAISAGLDDEQSVIQITIGTIFPSLLLSGIIWPLEGMPGWVRVIANFSPLTHTAEAMRCVASRGWGFGYFEVWFGTVIVIAWSFLFNLVAIIIFSITQ